MALRGWLLDKSAAVRADDPEIGSQLDELSGNLFLCPMGELEYLFSARSAREYDHAQARLHDTLNIVQAPSDILERTLILQHDLAHFHGLWHRVAIGDLVIAETALFHDLGIVHVDSDYERIAAVRPTLMRRRLG